MTAAVLNQIGDTRLELRADVTTTDVGLEAPRAGATLIRRRATSRC